MVKRTLRPLVFAGGIALLATSPQAVRAAQHGERFDAEKAQPVNMSFSGSMVPTSIDVQPNTITDEEILAGNGSLGPFTFRKLRTDATAPESFGSCGRGSGPTVRVVAGGGVFRFRDGSLLTVSVTEGALCVDVDHLVGHLTETYQISGGTGRFAGATGVLRSTGRLKPVMFSASGAAVLLTNAGQMSGTVQVP